MTILRKEWKWFERAESLVAFRLLLVAMATIVVVTVAFYSRFVVDDAYIVARYAENFVNWGSLVFNKGELIFALTSPMHVLLETLLYRATGATLLSYKIVSIILFLGMAFLVYHSFRGDPLALCVSLSLTVCSPYIILWVLGGLETPILLFLTTLLTVCIYSTKKFTLSRLCFIYILVALSFLTRFDSILYTLPLVAYTFTKGEQFKKFFIASIVGLCTPLMWILISIWNYGDIFPTSFYVKTPSMQLNVMLDNILYIAQYTIYTGIVPFAIFLSLIVSSKRRLFQTVIAFIREHWGVCLGLFLMLGYGCTVATIHMMFSFRFFVPFIPSAIITLVFLLRELTSIDGGRDQLFLGNRVIQFVVVAITLQALQIGYVYEFSLNPTIGNKGEFSKDGIQGTMNGFLPPEETAQDIQRHWAALPQSKERPPRIFTFAGGILPYNYKEAYFYETLVSYRHYCKYDWRLSADYINILTYHGSIDVQLPKPVATYDLVANYPFTFEGKEVNYMTFYNPTPDINRLSPRIDGGCN